MTVNKVPNLTKEQLERKAVYLDLLNCVVEAGLESVYSTTLLHWITDMRMENEFKAMFLNR